MKTYLQEQIRIRLITFIAQWTAEHEANKVQKIKPDRSWMIRDCLNDIVEIVEEKNTMTCENKDLTDFAFNPDVSILEKAAKMANDEQIRIMELDEPKKWWHKYLGKDTFFEHVFGGLIPDLILEAQQLERERIVGVVDRLDQEMRCHPDEIHCTCWIHAYDVLKKELY